MVAPTVTKRQRVRRRIDHAVTPVSLTTDCEGSATYEDLQAAVQPPVDPIADADACVLGHQPNVERYIGRLCRRHYDSIGNRLDQVIELYAALSVVIVPPYSLGPVAAQYAPGSEPGRLEVMVITDRRANGQQRPPSVHADPLEPAVFDVLSVLGSWVQRVWLVLGRDTGFQRPEYVAVPGVGPVRTDRPHLTLEALAKELRSNRHWIAQQPWVDRFLDALELVHRSLARAAGDSMWPKPIGTCPNCQAPMWHDAVLAEMATCRRCKTTWSGVALVRLRLIHEMESR